MADSGVADSGVGARGPRLEAVAIALLATALWLVSRPFSFTQNDGYLYALMALAWNDPQRFGGDLFLRHGSQDAFSCFSPLYGWMIARLGLTAATLGLLLAGASLWLAGCWRLLRTLLDAPRAQAGLIACAALQIPYGGFATLYLGEAFLTSRIFAEALVLLALAELARSAWARSVMLFVAGAAFHPLMALGGIGVAFLAEGFRRPWLLIVAALGVAASLSFAAVGVVPFERLFLVVDGPWLRLVQMRNGFVFLNNWGLHDWTSLAAQVAAVAAAALRANGWHRRFFIATGVVAALALIISWLGADVFHSALIVQLQLWRSVWPLAWASLAAAIFLAPRTRDPASWIVPALIAGALVVRQDALAAALALGGLTGAALHRPLLAVVAKAVLAAVLIVVSADVIGQAAQQIAIWWLTQERHLPQSVAVLNARYRLTWLLGAVCLLLVWRWPRAAVLVAAGLLVFAGASWDQRDAWQRYVMAGAPPLKVEGSVLWGKRAAASWFLLHAPAYVSLTQASGLLFSRDTALAWQARQARSRGITPNTAWTAEQPISTCAEAEPALTASDIRAICREADHPALIITRGPVPGAEGGVFETPAEEVLLCRTGAEVEARRARRFYAFACSDSPSTLGAALSRRSATNR